jgi:hypothetical protein
MDGYASRNAGVEELVRHFRCQDLHGYVFTYDGICIDKAEILDDIVAARSTQNAADDELAYLSFDREDLAKTETYWARIRGFFIIGKVKKRRARLK